LGTFLCVGTKRFTHHQVVQVTNPRDGENNFKQRRTFIAKEPTEKHTLFVKGSNAAHYLTRALPVTVRASFQKEKA